LRLNTVVGFWDYVCFCSQVLFQITPCGFWYGLGLPHHSSGCACLVCVISPGHNALFSPADPVLRYHVVLHVSGPCIASVWRKGWDSSASHHPVLCVWDLCGACIVGFSSHVMLREEQLTTVRCHCSTSTPLRGTGVGLRGAFGGFHPTYR
jgi:hypothetical protein